jgi:hypothetical protein
MSANLHMIRIGTEAGNRFCGPARIGANRVNASFKLDLWWLMAAKYGGAT